MHETKRVGELHGFEVAEGDPDVRGWEVVARDGRRIGEVEELLVDGEDRSIRYLEVRLDPRPAAGAAEARPTGGAVDAERDAIPELDRLSDDGRVIGHVTVPGDGPHEMPARTVGEALVRDSLLDIENQMIAGASPGGGFDRGQRRALIPFERAHLETDKRRIRIDSLPPS
jgi:hypothetical protein